MALEVRAKEQRLRDISRGKQFFQQIDNLAHQQWNQNTPRNQTIKRRATFGYYDRKEIGYEERFLMRKNAALVAHPQRVQSELPPAKQKENVNVRKRVQSENLGSFGIEHGKLEPRLFNQWGYVPQPFSEKIQLEKENSTIHKIRFRDEMKVVSKPVPKKGVPMSRIMGKNNGDRKLKTSTDFRSQNGVVTIIRPFDPNPECPQTENAIMDLNAIEREQTTMMLKRIDRMLHPDKHMDDALPDSMYEERISRSPNLSEISVHDLERQFEKYHFRQDTTLTEKQNMTKNPTYHLKPLTKKFLSHKDLLKEPTDKVDMRSFNKCKKWVRRWFDENLPQKDRNKILKKKISK